MKRNVKNLGLIVVIVVIVAMLSGGCCCYICPTCPQETHPESVEKILQCLLLEWFRPLTSLATRWFMSEVYHLVSKIDILWALNQIGPWECCMSYDEIIDGIHALEGYKYVPVGYVEYLNGTRVNVVICKVEGEKKAFLFINGKLEELICNPEELICNPLIIDVVI